ncbi:MAG: hypothetical protein Q9198_006249 [Flavoplaca austrocitrina]
MYTSSLPDRSKPPKAQKQKPTKQPKLANPPKAKRQETAKPAPDDPQMMFKVGFLSDVYQERLLESGIIKKVITRLSTYINFGFAKQHGGDCYLRFDDTNPKGEEEQYSLRLKRWSKAEVIAQRGGGEGEGKPLYACSLRDRPVAESLAEFRAMRDGK